MKPNVVKYSGRLVAVFKTTAGNNRTDVVGGGWLAASLLSPIIPPTDCFYARLKVKKRNEAKLASWLFSMEIPL